MSAWQVDNHKINDSFPQDQVESIARWVWRDVQVGRVHWETGVEKCICRYVDASTDLREISQNFRHLVATLATPYIDNDITVGVLGQ